MNTAVLASVDVESSPREMHRDVAHFTRASPITVAIPAIAAFVEPAGVVRIDFFIMNCTLLGIGGGDCRDFNKDATYGQSRVQLYLDPETHIWEVKYNSTKFVLGGKTLKEMKDSAKVFNPDKDVTILSTGPDGFIITMKFTNNACAYFNGVCPPPIDATVSFDRDPSSPGGWRVSFNRDGFPSMGVYSRKADDSGFDVVKEDPQKVHNGVAAMLALAGKIRSSGSNAPPPANPRNCQVQ